jgi:hypothetical protein
MSNFVDINGTKIRKDTIVSYTIDNVKLDSTKPPESSFVKSIFDVLSIFDDETIYDKDTTRELTIKYKVTNNKYHYATVYEYKSWMTSKDKEKSTPRFNQLLKELEQI